jgi:CBS domain-containing protein
MQQRERDSTMNIGSICQRRLVTIERTHSLAQAATLMRERHVGALVVTTSTAEGPRVDGVVTDRDLVVGALAEGLDAASITVGSLASERLVSVNELDDLGDAVAAMQASGVRRLLVTDDEAQLIGIVSLDDLLAAYATEIDGLAKVIRSGIDREVAETDAAPEEAPAPPLRVPAIGTAGWRP